MTHKATMGRIVHYYQGDWEAPDGQQDASWRGTNGTRWHPAVITHVHTDTCVNLMVMWDAGTPSSKTSMTHLPDEVFADGMHCTNSCWRWPERV